MKVEVIQREFLRQVLSDDASAPPEWGSDRMQAGLAVYRNGYRSRLIDALSETFPRTRQWVGEESFERAAAHHLIAHPPGHWSLDRAGEGFPETLAALFVRDPEVPELAALEWDMHLAFVAPDAQPINAIAFADATADFTESDWQSLCLQLHPALAIRAITTSAAAIWRALSEESEPPPATLLNEPAYVIVWRERTKPVFRSVELREAYCIREIQVGSTFETMCQKLALDDMTGGGTEFAGAILARWLGSGLVTGLRVTDSGSGSHR